MRIPSDIVEIIEFHKLGIEQSKTIKIKTSCIIEYRTWDYFDELHDIESWAYDKSISTARVIGQILDFVAKHKLSLGDLKIRFKNKKRKSHRE